MPFKPGQSGNPSGRSKKLLKRTDEILHEAGIHPVVELLKLLPKLVESKRADVLLELLAYVQPKPKEMLPDEEDALRAAYRQLSEKELEEKAKEFFPVLKAG